MAEPKNVSGDSDKKNESGGQKDGILPNIFAPLPEKLRAFQDLISMDLLPPDKPTKTTEGTDEEEGRA